MEEFAADVAAGTLPSVSWLVGPANVSEHANWHPSAGEDLTARILAVLAANPAVYAKTLFLFSEFCALLLAIFIFCFPLLKSKT